MPSLRIVAVVVVVVVVVAAAAAAAVIAVVTTTTTTTITSLPKVIWEQGRVAGAVPGAGWHKGLMIRNVCIVFVKDRCAKVRYFSARKQE